MKTITLNKITRVILLGTVLVFVYFLFILLSNALTPPADYSVNDLGDAADANAGDGICATAGAVCTLRAAIQEANATVGAEVIDFNGIDTTTQQTITVASELPVITEQIVITAEEQWEIAGDRPGILLTKTGSVAYGLKLSDTADNSRISGLKIEGFDDYGIFTAAETSQIGMDCVGTPDDTQRNVIVANGRTGLHLGSADNNIIAGNWIGLDDDGVTSDPNGGGTLTHSYTEMNMNNSNSNVIGYEDGDDYPAYVCTAAQARNVFGIGSYNSITLDNSSTKNKISGNYINVLPDGSAEISHSERWGAFFFNANYNWIGTDGDGTNDDLEGNVIGPFALGGVYGNSNGSIFTGNRISGNIFGGNPAGTAELYTGSSAETGIRLSRDAEDHVIGFCDDTEDSLIGDNDMCSNGGAAADQANYFIGLDGTADGTSYGLLLSVWTNTANIYVYGNKFGVGTDDSAIGNHYGASLYYNLFGTGKYYTIGDQGDRANVFMNNEVGVNIENSTVDAALMQYVKVQYNTISENVSHGVQVVRGKQAQDVDSAHDILIENNTITDNGGSGIYLSGSSADITSNTITGNTGYGIYALSTYDNLVSSYAKQTALGASTDLVSEPFNIGGSGTENTISGNLLGGIYFLDTKPADAAQLYTDNTFADNNSQPAIRTAWWGAVELLDTSFDPITTGSHSITVTPDSGSASTGSTVDTGEFAGENDSEGAWGPDGFDYDDQTTWFTLVDYEYDTDGNYTSYNPHTVSVTGDNANDNVAASFSFSGSGSGSSEGGLPVGISTGSGIYRYQVAEAVVSSVSDTPVNATPVNGAARQVTTPTLTSSVFSDLTETHSGSYWQIYSTEVLCQANGTGDVYDSGESTDLESHRVQAGGFPRSTDIWWSVQYKNSYGNLSAASTCTSFQVRANSSNSGLVPGVEEVEDEEGVENVEDLESVEDEMEDGDQSMSGMESESEGVVSEVPLSNFEPAVNEMLLATADGYVTNEDYSTVYYQSGDNILHPFYNLEIFSTWANGNDPVAVLPQSTLEAMPIGSWMLPKPGTVWVTLPQNDIVYAIQENPEDEYSPILLWISSETVAMGLLGPDWAEYIIDIPLRLYYLCDYQGKVDRTNDHEINIENMIKREELIP
jgi:CSLREA domain-containing protein